MPELIIRTSPPVAPSPALFRNLDISLGTEFDPNGIKVSAVQSGNGISAVIDSTIVTGAPALARGGLGWIFDMLDPDDAVAGTFPWTPPTFWIQITTPPPAASGVDVLVGIVDGTNIVTQQYLGGGIGYGIANPTPRSQDQTGSTDGPASVGSSFAYVDFLARPSVNNVGGMFVLRAAASIYVNNLGGTGTGIQNTANDEYTNTLKLFVAIASSGTGGDAAMPVAFEWGYLAARQLASLTIGP